MIAVINEKIVTGDDKVDATIEHAKKQFFGTHSTLDSKRSACESLSFVIEPLRNDLSELFSGDTEAFFQIVNTFTVRHNKALTKRIEHEEQLEWIFFSLLNTLNTYVKLKRKLA